MQIQCKTLTPNPTPPPLPFQFQFPTSPSSSSFPPNSTRIPFPSLKTRATLPRNSTTPSASKPVSEMTFYELLGLSTDVSLVEIKHAYKQLARTYHPDVSPPDLVKEYTDRFIRVQEAYQTLSDPNMRAVYDRDMARGLHLAFSARRNKNKSPFDDEDVDDKSDWRIRWQSQVSELKKRSMFKDAKQNSWGARMRRQRNGASS